MTIMPTPVNEVHALSFVRCQRLTGSFAIDLSVCKILLTVVQYATVIIASTSTSHFPTCQGISAPIGDANLW